MSARQVLFFERDERRSVRADLERNELGIFVELRPCVCCDDEVAPVAVPGLVVLAGREVAAIAEAVGAMEEVRPSRRRRRTARVAGRGAQ